MRYPNLNEMVAFHPYGIPAICDHGNIETELLYAALNGNENLEKSELQGIARLYGVPYGFLSCSKLIRLDNKRYEHQQLMNEISGLYLLLKEMAASGNDEAIFHFRLIHDEYHQFNAAWNGNLLTYGRYLGMRASIEEGIFFSRPKPQKRGLRA